MTDETPDDQELLYASPDDEPEVEEEDPEVGDLAPVEGEGDALRVEAPNPEYVEDFSAEELTDIHELLATEGDLPLMIASASDSDADLMYEDPEETGDPDDIEDLPPAEVDDTGLFADEE